MAHRVFAHIDEDFAIIEFVAKFLSLLLTDKICIGMTKRGSLKKYS